MRNIKIKTLGSTCTVLVDADTDEAITCPFSACGGDGRADFLCCETKCAAYHLDQRPGDQGHYCRVHNFMIGV